MIDYILNRTSPTTDRLLGEAPTILHWFGLPIARDIDGKVLTEIFRERSAPAEKSVLYRESSGETDKIKLKVKKLKESRHI